MNRCFGSGSGWSVFKVFYNSTLQYRKEIFIHWKNLQNTHVAISRHISSAIWHMHVDYAFVDLIKIFMCTCWIFFTVAGYTVSDHQPFTSLLWRQIREMLLIPGMSVTPILIRWDLKLTTVIKREYRLWTVLLNVKVSVHYSNPKDHTLASC